MSQLFFFVNGARVGGKVKCGESSKIETQQVELLLLEEFSNEYQKEVGFEGLLISLAGVGFCCVSGFCFRLH